MIEKTTRRPFATGSKPGPDAVDQYLEAKGFYRKHVARDASSVFRVVSEQVLDIQNYHEKLRQDCAAFMEANSKDYANEVDKNFYNYVSLLRKPRTHGSLLELRVMARMYKKNVILFEPTQSLQTTSSVYVHDDEYDSKNPMRVFYSQKDKHFDVIYTMETVERLAECQAIVYSILYTDVFQLPDVKYAVEIMLHDQDEELTLPLEDDPSKYKTQSGEVVPFNDSCGTNCVLKDPKTCHFHNQDDFEEVVNLHKDSITIINRTDDPGRLKIFKPIDGFLHDKTKSCVRQLLDEHITPFPYKVAKALDPSIYRNTEFELWSENRKEQRSKWFDMAEYPMKHLDDKWLYDRRSPYGVRKYSEGKFEAAVVDESAYMALDDAQKKKYVILNPGAEPFNLHQLTSGLDHFVPSKESLEMTVMPMHASYPRGGYKSKPRGGGRYNNGNYHGNYHHQNPNNSGGHNSFKSQHHHHSGGHQPPMTHVSDIERDGTYQFTEQPQQQQEGQEFYSQQQEQQVQPMYQEQYEQPQMHTPQPMYQLPPQQGWSNVSYIPNASYPVMGQHIPFAAPMGYQQVMPYGNFSIPPPMPQMVQPQGHGGDQPGDLMRIIRESDLSSTAINWKPRESVDLHGSDLPLSDIPSLQFFFNLGVRYYYGSGVQRQLESVATQLENLELNENSCAPLTTLSAPPTGEKFNEGAQTKPDQPPVPTNTPVTTKPIGGSHYGPPGNRYNNQHPGFRRPNGPNRDRDQREGGNNFRGNSNWNNNNSRKEIKFNSNVKNAHKLDTKSGGGNGGNQVSHAGSQTGGLTLLATSSGNLNDKLSPSTIPVPHFSPISPINTESSTSSQFHHQNQPNEAQPQTPQVQHHYFSSYSAQQPAFIPSQQQGVSMVYQIPDDGSFMMPMQLPQFAPQPYPYQVQTPQPMPPQVFYQMPPNFQPQTSTMEGSTTVSSNDSGVEANVYQGYQQPPQYYPQVFFTTTPIPQTPMTAQMPPLYPAPPIMTQHVQQQAPPPVNVVATSQSSLDRTVSTHSDENTGENSGSV